MNYLITMILAFGLGFLVGNGAITVDIDQDKLEIPKAWAGEQVENAQKTLKESM
jgi:hypothetical protein